MQYVTQNPRKVLEMLGLDPDAIGAAFYKLNIRKSRTMPEKKTNKYNNNNHNHHCQNEEEEEAVDDELKEKLCPFFWDPQKDSDVLGS